MTISERLEAAVAAQNVPLIRYLMWLEQQGEVG